MSVLDQLRALEQQVQRRLRELGPLVAEYRDLEKVAARLGLKREDPVSAEAPAAESAAVAASTATPSRSRAPKAAAKKPRASRRPAKPRASKRSAKPKAEAIADTASGEAKPSPRRRTVAAPGKREQDVLRLVRARPGITVAELAVELGVDATGLYAVVRRLQSAGEIRKDGSRLQPVIEATPATDVGVLVRTL